MKPSVMRYLVYAQICFYLGLLACIIIKPAGLTDNSGISYYGVHKSTIVPYVFAFFGAAFCCFEAAEDITDPDFRLIKYSLSIAALFMIGVLLTPDTWGTFMDDAHRGFGASLFILQLLLGGWLVMQLGYRLWAIGLLALQFAAGLASFLWLAPQHGFLLEAQVIFQLSFGILAILALRELSADFTESGG